MWNQKLFESTESIFDLSPISQISDLICGAAAHCGREWITPVNTKMMTGKRKAILRRMKNNDI